MQQIDRRKFLGMAAAGTAAAATAASAAPVYSLLGGVQPGHLNFRAAGGLPQAPLPAYATALVEGTVDTSSGTGVVAYRIIAGQPNQPSDVALPGLTRMVRITNVARRGGSTHMDGVVEDRSVLASGESATMRFVLDQANRQLKTTVSGTEVSLPLI